VFGISPSGNHQETRGPWWGYAVGEREYGDEDEDGDGENKFGWVKYTGEKG